MKKYICIFTFAILISACTNMDDQSERIKDSNDEIQEVSASESNDRHNFIEVDLKSSSGDRVGIVHLSEQKEGVKIQIEAWNLPEGIHGFHIHEKGICEEPGFESAGGHFNPTNKKHGFDHPEGPHAGDLLNLEVGKDGKLYESFIATMVTLEKGKENSLLQENGTSLIIHANEDDYISQPAGNAGDRIACGVIHN